MCWKLKLKHEFIMSAGPIATKAEDTKAENEIAAKQDADGIVICSHYQLSEKKYISERKS